MASAGERELSTLEQAESVGRGSASCSRPWGDGGGFDPILLLHEEPLGRGGRVRQRRGSRCAKIRAINEALTPLNSFAGFKGHPGEPFTQVHKEVRARCLALASWWRQGADAPSSAEAALSALLRGISVYGDDGPRNTLVPFNADLVSVPEDLNAAPKLLEVLPQVSRRFLEGDQERTQLEDGGEAEVSQSCLDPALKHCRRQALLFFLKQFASGLCPAGAHRQRVRWTVLCSQERW